MSDTTVLPVEVTTRRSKAAELRSGAVAFSGPLAIAYRRRAAELELEATAIAARLGYEETLQLAA